MASETDIEGEPPEADDDSGTGIADPRAEIARLEARIDDLAEAIARCRKFILAGRIAIAAGAIWMLAAITGAIVFDAMAMLAAIAALLGGTVAVGSNMTTLKEMSAMMNEAETRRAGLIGMLRLRVVGQSTLPPD